MYTDVLICNPLCFKGVMYTLGTPFIAQIQFFVAIELYQNKYIPNYLISCKSALNWADHFFKNILIILLRKGLILWKYKNYMI